MKHRIVILGGGFGGLSTAREVEKRIGADSDVEITLVNRENFFLFMPLLHEVAASDFDPTELVNAIRNLLKQTHFFVGMKVQVVLSGSLDLFFAKDLVQFGNKNAVTAYSLRGSTEYRSEPAAQILTLPADFATQPATGAKQPSAS